MAKITDARLPENIEQGATFDLTRRAEIVELANGWEERNTPQAHHRRRITLSYGAGDTSEIKAIRDTWAVALGPVYAFRFKDWSDYKTSSEGVAPAASDQLIGTGDGVAVDFQLSKTVSFGSSTYTHPISAPVSGSVLITVDGVAQTEGVDFTVDYETGIITFTTAPALGLEVSIGCLFDVWVRFENTEFSLSHLIYIEDDANHQISQTGEIVLIEVLEP